MFRHISGNRIKRTYREIDPEDVFLDSHNIPTFNTDQMEGHLERPLPSYFGYLVLITIFLVFSVFIGKLYSMQIKEADTYRELADKNHLKSTPIFAHRGTISDRKGEVLAWNDSAGGNHEIPERRYTKIPGFSNLLGYVSYPKKDVSGIFWQDTYIGRDGIEKAYNAILQGMTGEKIIAVNAAREIESENVIVDPIKGENIKLSIDGGVQAKLYERMQALSAKAGFTGGAAVIMDVHTGEILALASFPEYDNNLITNATSTEDRNRVAKDLVDKRGKFINRAISGLFTPGSTVKPFVAIAALMEDVITPEKQIYSSGALVIKNKYGGPDTVFKDWKAHGYVDMREALSVSSDEYFYQVGGGYQTQKGLGIEKIHTYATMFGFGTTTGIDLPNEKFGTIPSPEWKKKTFGEDWLVGNTYHTAIGQYGFQVTPLELTRAVASIANGGYLVTPHLFLSLDVGSSSIGLQEQDLRVIREGMREGVLTGTAKALNLSGVTIAAKSGTAELGITKQLVNSWISGYFPYENPRYAFVVIMEKGDRHNPYGAVFVMRETLEWMRDNTDYTK
ncbi:MAG: penicillin-binding protein 2 [Patescibacteria group bacterium]|nr:penicillin-binding protein 2 [Patescibacteria group bacterium]